MFNILFWISLFNFLNTNNFQIGIEEGRLPLLQLRIQRMYVLKTHGFCIEKVRFAAGQDQHTCWKCLLAQFLISKAITNAQKPNKNVFTVGWGSVGNCSIEQGTVAGCQCFFSMVCLEMSAWDWFPNIESTRMHFEDMIQVCMGSTQVSIPLTPRTCYPHRHFYCKC